MVFFNEIVHEKNINPKNNCILVADIGGTTTDFALLIKKKENFRLLVSLHFRSEKIKDFTKTVLQVTKHLQDKHKLTAEYSCFAGAGVVSKKGINLTNLPWNVDAKMIRKKTGFRSSTVINDFQAIAYGIEALPKKKVGIVQKGKAVSEGARVIIGAGTGLGKSILFFDDDIKRYVSFPAEGGHADLPVLDTDELKLKEFIAKQDNNAVVEWEDVLSGRGLSNIYKFLSKNGKYKKTKYSLEIKKAKYDSMLITQYKNEDKQCKDTFSIFLKFYGRCAKNSALDVLAEGGVYIAGGIAAKNNIIFKKKIFKQEFIRSKKQKRLLKNIPVYVIKDYNVSLYGAAIATLRK